MQIQHDERLFSNYIKQNIMNLFEKIFRVKKQKELTAQVSELNINKTNNNLKIVSQSEMPDYCNVGNLVFEKKYNEAIELGEKLLFSNPNSAGAHINLMDAYFKARKENETYLDLSTYHAKQAIIYGHNTGYAHNRLVINLEKNKLIFQAIQLCDIVLSERYHFSPHGCGKKEDFLFKKEKLKYKINTAKDNELSKLFTDKEINLLYENLDSLIQTNCENEISTGFSLSEEEIEKQLKIIRDKANGIKKEYILPIEPKQITIDNIALGLQYEQIIKSLPEFDFYVNEEQGFTQRHFTLINDPKQGKAIWDIQRKFKEMINSAYNYEKNGDLNKAAKLYERIITEQYWLPTPYDRLIKIYSKAKLKYEEIRVLQYSINHFTSLRNRQKEYVIKLANKYNKEEFVFDRIQNNKKIFYYDGMFELYNPLPISEIWEKRLSKLKFNNE